MGVFIFFCVPKNNFMNRLLHELFKEGTKEMNEIRKPVVAGQFYDASEKELKKTIEKCFTDKRGPGEISYIKNKGKNIIGVVVPHAGFIYSGPIAAYSYKEIFENGFAETFIILGPNHTGMGAEVATLTKGKWLTPLGEIKIDTDLAKKICTGIINDDRAAHIQEHSIEVQIPFLQYIGKNKKFRFVPITMGLQNIKTSEEVGEIIFNEIKDEEKKIVIIASSDFSHVGFNYMTMPPEDMGVDEYAAKQDRIAIEKILDLDSTGLIKKVGEENISMCGYGPIATMINVAKKLGAKKAELLKYGTSYEVHPHSSCVGYGSISVY